MDVWEEHLGYVRDRKRLELFRQAIARVVYPGDRILDLGCGIGVLGWLCLEQGAGHIDAVDHSDALPLARDALAKTPYADRIRYHAANASRFAPERLADVVVCDHVGYFGFDYGILDLLHDARTRLLAPGGRLLPQRLRPFVSLISSESVDALGCQWSDANVPDIYRGFDRYRRHQKQALMLAAKDVVAPPLRLAELALGDSPPELLQAEWSIRLPADARIDAVSGWFEAELAPGLFMTNSPLSPDAIDRPQAVFPLDAPLSASAGDELRLRALIRPSERLFHWRLLHVASGVVREHSTLHGRPLDLDRLRAEAPDRIPMPGEEHRRRALVMSYCDGIRTAAEIRELVEREHPALLPNRADIGRFVENTLRREAE